MSISLSIISGKGGCGKTTLALSLSQMLAGANAKVLLVDCDMSTHGATYFFESLLLDKEKILTMVDVLSSNSKQALDSKQILNVRKNIDFIPSCVYLTKDYLYNIEIPKNILELNQIAMDKYDVVIYDCQAGYSPVTESAVMLSSQSLVVLETDAITSSSTRVLSAQLANYLQNGTTYQVFNKVPREDFEIYSKVTHGTFFTNLTPILYDVSVKKAFAINALPEIDIENTSFSNNIYELSYSLFPSMRMKLQKFIAKFKTRMRNHTEKKIYDLLRKQKEKKMTRIKENLLSFTICLFTTIVAGAVLPNIENIMYDMTQIILMLCLILVGIGVALVVKSLSQIIKFKDPDIERELSKLNLQIQKLDEEIQLQEYEVIQSEENQYRKNF